MFDRSKYTQNHVVGAQSEPPSDGDLSWAWDMLVVLYGTKPTDSNLKAYVGRLKAADSPPKAVYILDGMTSQLFLLPHTQGHFGSSSVVIHIVFINPILPTRYRALLK